MKKKPGILDLLTPYKGPILLLLLFTLLGNAVNLVIPRIIANGIDAFSQGQFHFRSVILVFAIAVILIFVFTYLQSIIQTYASERVARDLRTKLVNNISGQSNAFIEAANPSRLLTNLTADVDSIKLFVSQAIVSIVSSAFIIIGASILLLLNASISLHARLYDLRPPAEQLTAFYHAMSVGGRRS